MNSLRKKLARKVRVKRLDGQTLNGPMLVELA